MVGRGRFDGLRVFRIEFSDPEVDLEKVRDLDNLKKEYGLSEDLSVIGGGILSVEESLLFLDVEKPYGSRVAGRRGFEDVELEYKSKLPIVRVYRTDEDRGRGYFSDPRGECPEPKG